MLRCGKVADGDGQVETVAFSRRPRRKNATCRSLRRSFGNLSTIAGHGHFCPAATKTLGRACSTVLDSVEPRLALSSSVLGLKDDTRQGAKRALMDSRGL